jgi:putative oxidoreductase
VLLQRLFSAFPNGWPGRGLLLQRAVTAALLSYSGFQSLNEASGFALIFQPMIATGAGFFLLIGLWTPICGTLIAVAEVWIALSCADGGRIQILLATSAATLAMIGPGAWSMDARLFGRKHYEFPQR